MGSQPKNISASRGAAILGMSKWRTPVDIWFELMEERESGFCESQGFETPVREENAAMRWGLAFEEAIEKLAEENWNCRDAISWKSREQFFEIENGLITCHIDGQYIASGNLHEGKTTNPWTFKDEWGEPGTDRIPIEYQIQVQHQMLCTGAAAAIVSVLVFPCRQDEWEEKEIAIPEDPIHWARILAEMGYFHQFEVKANLKLRNLMRNKYLSWWEKYIQGRKPPPIKIYSDARKLIRAPSGTIRASGQMERWAEEYKQIGKEIGIANKRKNELKALILEECQKGAAIEDEASSDKWLIVNDQGKKLFTYNGERFR